MMKALSVICAAVAIFVVMDGVAWAATIEPRYITQPSELKPGEGALLLSIRHQTPISQTMHVRFAALDGSNNSIKFERKVGLGGRTRMLAREVRLYAVPVGRWTLSSHIAGCDLELDADHECVYRVASQQFPLPQGKYNAGWISFTIVPGGITKLGEMSLEFPADVVFGVPATPDSTVVRMRSLRFKLRPLPLDEESLIRPFDGLPQGTVSRLPEAASNIICERPAQDLKLYYNPFNC